MMGKNAVWEVVMEKGAQIVTDLYEIQDVVQRYTDIISIIADVDVECCR